MRMSILNRPVQLLIVIALPVLCSAPGVSAALPSPTSIVERNLGGDTILSAPAQKLVATVRDSVKENQARSGRIVQAVLSGGRADTDALAPQVTVAAIEGLGTKPTDASIGDIVYYAVKAAPAVVLETVRAAAKAAPGYGRTIVRAAIKAVPNPNDKIQPIGETTQTGTSDYSKDDPKDAKDMAEANPIPIGEAIAQAAMQGDPSLSYQDLITTITETTQEPNPFPAYKGYYYPPLLPVVSH